MAAVEAELEPEPAIEPARRDLVVRNLAQIATAAGTAPIRADALRQLRVIENGAVAIRNGRFAWIGSETDLPAEWRGAHEVDGGRGTLLPGFVDSHTHLPFAGTRASEFNQRLHGATYQEIAAGGGGILSTVQATRAASQDELTENVLQRTSVMATYGTTTAEVKSGYGLNLDDELKQLRAIAAAGKLSPVRLVPTCLAAHEFPPEARGDAAARAGYVDEVADVIVPAAAEAGLARYCDVFVEQGIFTREEGRRILEAGKRYGLVPRLHGDELSDTGGAELATEVGAASADHLMYVSDRGIAALAASNTVANLLPATSFFLMSPQYAPARRLIDAGAIVSLSTDCNPGSSMTESMQIVIQLACLQMKMTVEEALTAATLNGAFSVGLAAETGSISIGKQADFIILDAPGYLHLVYHFGVNLVREVYRDGVRIVSRSP